MVTHTNCCLDCWGTLMQQSNISLMITRHLIQGGNTRISVLTDVHGLHNIDLWCRSGLMGLTLFQRLWGSKTCSPTRLRMLSHPNKDGKSTTLLCAAPRHLGHFDGPIIYPAQAIGAIQTFKCYLQGYLFGPTMRKKSYLFRDSQNLTLDPWDNFRVPKI